VAEVTTRDRQIRVTGERREQIDIHRIADLFVQLARSGLDFTSLIDTDTSPGPKRSEESDDQTETPG
jgi:hypothetical protein